VRPGGSQSPEGQTETEVSNRGGFRTAPFRVRGAASFFSRCRFQHWAGPPFPYLRWSGPLAGRGGHDGRLVSFCGVDYPVTRPAALPWAPCWQGARCRRPHPVDYPCRRPITTLATREAALPGDLRVRAAPVRTIRFTPKGEPTWLK
jgi:hypothetical protein